MLQLEYQTLEPRKPQLTKSAIMVIGGAEDKVHGREILQTFFSRAGSADAQIAIVPSVRENQRSSANDIALSSRKWVPRG